VAVGDFDPDRVEALIRRHFEPIPAAESPRERRSFQVPSHDETLFSRITDPELSRTTVAVHYKHPAQPQGRYGDYRRSLVQSLYHGMLNARLDEVGQEADPPFLFAHSGMGGFVRSASVFSQQAAVRDGGVIRGLEALLTEVERIDRHGFTAGELERAKANILRSYEQAYKERDKLDSGALAAELVRSFLHGEAVPGIEAELELVRRFLPTIDLEEVNRQARRWITEENRVIVVTGPEKEEAPLPTEEELLAAFEAAEAREVKPYVDRVRDAPLLAEEPTPGEIVAESEIPELGVTEWRLSNGVRVVMKPTDFQNDQVLLSAWSPGGHSLVADEDYPTAVLAASIVGEGGLGAFDRIELGKALAGKVATAQAFISELEEGLSGFASPADLEILFQLVHLRFTAPRIDREAFGALISKLRILVKNRDSRPQTVFNDRMTEILSQGHPRRRPMSEEMLAQVDADKALEIYRDRFADASDFTFVLAGNFDPEELREPVRRYLASLPATGRGESWRDVGVRRPQGVERFEVEKGLEPKSRVSLRFFGDAEWSREAQHRIASLGQLFQIRLREILREEMGGTYGASVGGSIATRPVERYSVSVGFGCAPEEVEPLTAAVFEEIERLRAEPVDESYVHKLQEIQRRQRETDLEKNSFWVAALETYYSLGLDPRLLLDHDRLVAGLTAEELRRAARRYLDEDRYVLGVLYPEAAAPAEDGSAEDGSVEDGSAGGDSGDDGGAPRSRASRTL
jgi:zinc protease